LPAGPCRHETRQIPHPHSSLIEIHEKIEQKVQNVLKVVEISRKIERIPGISGRDIIPTNETNDIQNKGEPSEKQSSIENGWE
jgi:hypothetical protein